MSFSGLSKWPSHVSEAQRHSTPSSQRYSTPFFSIFPENTAARNCDESGYFSYVCKDSIRSPAKRCFDDLMDWNDDVPVPKRLSFSNLAECSFSEYDVPADSPPPWHNKKRRFIESIAEAPPRYVDFVAELQKRNCTHIISNILSNLSAKDLCSLSCVSQKWREAVSEDSAASSQKKKFLKKKRKAIKNKENKHKKGTKVPHYGLLVDIQNIEPEPSRNPVVFLPFQELDQNQPGRPFLRCPQCFSPATVVDQSRCRCIRRLCQYEFVPPAPAHEISYEPPELFPQELENSLSLSICSTRNKRNLRRL